MDDYDKLRLDVLQKHYETLNREMGQIHGELRWIRWLLMALIGVTIVQYFA